MWEKIYWLSFSKSITKKKKKKKTADVTKNKEILLSERSTTPEPCYGGFDVATWLNKLKSLH